MSKTEILCTRYGEMLDLINCYAIYNGNAEQKRDYSNLSMESILFEMD